jgi:hypothetical protein
MCIEVVKERKYKENDDKKVFPPIKLIDTLVFHLVLFTAECNFL